MGLRRVLERVALAALAVGASTLLDPVSGLATPPLLFGHPVRLDREGRLLPWPAGDGPYGRVARLAWTALETKFPVQDNGLETWLGYSRFDPDTFEGIAWPHNPAGFYAMLTDSAALWYEYSGDAAAVAIARKALAHQLAHGTTPADWDWARVPYASAAAGDVDYGGADDSWCDSCGRGDGIGVIEPDKVGELGFAYLQMFELTGDATFRDAAIACADALADHVRPGDDKSSPWPFRVYARTNVVREEYTSNVVRSLSLFEELERLGLGRVQDYERARTMAQRWLFRVPLTNDAWSGYFEDVDIHRDPYENLNQYSPLSTARWLMAHPDADPQWRAHVAHLIHFTVEHFGGDVPSGKGVQWGAIVMSEQGDDTVKMASHTARFGTTLALWYEKTGDQAALDRAARSLAWATYACRDDGVVSVAEDTNEGWWFSDGYGDYIRHFLIAMGAVPAWAPRGEDHLLSSTSLVTRVAYAPGRVGWTTFDARATETLRLTFRPARVLAGGAPLAERPDLAADGYTTSRFASGGYLVRVRHASPEVVIVGP